MRWVSHSRIPINITFNIQHILRKHFIRIVKCIWNRIQRKRNCLIYFCIAWSLCSCCSNETYEIRIMNNLFGTRWCCDVVKVIFINKPSHNINGNGTIVIQESKVKELRIKLSAPSSQHIAPHSNKYVLISIRKRRKFIKTVPIPCI